MLPVSIYIHIPWCLKKCPYCDFNSFKLHIGPDSFKQDLYANYTKALIADLHLSIAEYIAMQGQTTDVPSSQRLEIASVFFGGGTPSLCPPKFIAEILNTIAALCTWPEARPLEVTLELNPASAEYYNLADFKAAGITRISMGAQSFNDQHLQLLGRLHSAADIRKVAKELGKLQLPYGYNLDLMYGLPTQTLAEALADLAAAEELESQHLSWYNLTLEPNTKFGAQPPAGLPDLDTMASIEEAGLEWLRAKGWQRYEVSAYSREEYYRCRHNLNYWQFGDYLGIGAGAHSKVSDLSAGRILRYQVNKHPNSYWQDLLKHRRQNLMTITSPQDLVFEFLLNRLRLLYQPIAASEWSQYIGLDFNIILPMLQPMIQQGLLQLNALTRDLSLTSLGQRHLDTILTGIMR